MRAMSVISGLVVGLVATAACGHGSPSTSSGGAAASAVPVAHEPMAVAAVEVWPARWPAVVSALPAPARAAIGDRDFWAVAELAAQAMGVRELAWPPAGIDPAAPIALEIYMSRAHFEATALALVRAISAGKPPDAAPLLQARVTLHAKDAAALATALRAAKVSGAQVSVAATGTTVIADVAIGGATGDAIPPAAIATFDAGDASAARAIARVDHLGELGTAIGLARMAQALASADARDLGDRKLELVANGIGESLTSYLWSDPATSFARAILVDVPADDARRPRIAFALTDAGKATLTAGGLARGRTIALGALRWSDAIAAAPLPALLQAAATADQPRDRETAVVHLVHQCGASCFWYIALGNGLAIVHALGMTDLGSITSGLGEVGLSWSTLETAELAWTNDDLLFVSPAGAGAPPTWRYAVTPPPPAADACYRRALVPLRAALAGDPRDAARWPAANSELASAAACTKADPVLAQRHRAMTDLAAALTPKPSP